MDATVTSEDDIGVTSASQDDEVLQTPSLVQTTAKESRILQEYLPSHLTIEAGGFTDHALIQTSDVVTTRSTLQPNDTAMEPFVGDTGVNLVILGSVVASVVVLALVTVTVCFVVRRRRRAKTSPRPASKPSTNGIQSGRTTWHEDEASQVTDDIDLQPSSTYAGTSYLDDGSYSEVYVQTIHEHRHASNSLTTKSNYASGGKNMLTIVESNSAEQSQDSDQVVVQDTLPYSAVYKSPQTGTMHEDALPREHRADECDKLSLQTANGSSSDSSDSESDPETGEKAATDNESDGDVYTNVGSVQTDDKLNVTTYKYQGRAEKTTSDEISTRSRAPVPQPRLSLKSRLPDPYDYPPRRAYSMQEVSSARGERYTPDIGENDVNSEVFQTEEPDDISEEGSSNRSEEEDVVYDIPRRVTGEQC